MVRPGRSHLEGSIFPIFREAEVGNVPPQPHQQVRGENGDTVKERRATPSPSPYRVTSPSYSGNLVFIVQDGEVVEVGEDTTEQS